MEPWSVEWKQHRLEQLYKDWAGCERCGLCEFRNTVVFGEGNPDADIIFVGEAPGVEEDKEGRPFMGQAGELFTALWESLGPSREEVFLTNVVACLTPEGRNPTRVEKETCLDRLHQIIYIVDPLVIVPLGKVALNALVGGRWGIESERGKLFSSPHPGIRTSDEPNGVTIPGKVFPRKGDDKKVYTLDYDCIPIHDPIHILKTDSYDEERDEFEPGGVAHRTLKDLESIIEKVKGLKREYIGIQKVL